MFADSQYNAPPIDRILATILGYAFRDGAREIHLQHPLNSKVSVSFRLREGEALHEQFKMPFYVLPQLRARLKELTGDNSAFEIELQSAEHQLPFFYKLQIRVSQHDDLMVLHLGGRMNFISEMLS